MTLQGSLIAPFQTGLDTDTEPWMSPADSFSVADNVHVFDGYIEKRSGYRVYGKLQELMPSVVITGITNAANGEVTTAVNHGYSTDDIVFISAVTGMTQVNDIYYTITVTGLTTFELNVDTTTFGVYTAAGTVSKSIDSTERVMGIYQFNMNDGSKETLAFSKKRAYKFDPIIEKFMVLDAADIMDGDETNYIWAINLQSSSLKNRLYFTNGKEFAGGLNGIRYYDGTGTGLTTIEFTPDLGGGRKLYGSKLLFSLKERLIAMFTYEFDGAATTEHLQRMRWCQAQGPSNWNDLTPGGGGFVDAPTGDQIVSGRYLQDQIVTCFSQSVWMAQPVSDPALPFRWQKLNDFRACDGKMASVGYDQYTMAIGNRGITATDGADTQRIDNRISDFVSNELNISEFDKVFAQRSYTERRTWILYPAIESDENSAALIFDEDSNAFTTYSIAMNCLGYGNLSGDYTLADFTAARDLDLVIDDFDTETLTSYVWQGKEELLLGGDISGTVYIMETDASDNGSSIDCVVQTAAWNPYLSQDSQAYFSYLDMYVDTDIKTKALIEFFKDDETAPYASQTINFLPNLEYISTVTNISQSNPGIITAPNHGLTTGDKIYVYGTDGMNEINDTQYTVTVIDQNSFSIGIDTTAYAAFTGDSSIYKRRFYKTKTWKRAFAGGVGYTHSVRITSSGIDSPIRISGFKPVFKPRGRRLVN
jgi:hypothetical protein